MFFSIKKDWISCLQVFPLRFLINSHHHLWTYQRDRTNYNFLFRIVCFRFKIEKSDIPTVDACLLCQSDAQ